MKKFFLQVVGLGPAGLGPFIAADGMNLLPKLLSKGVICFDSQFGQAGKIGDYSIISNSPTGDYLEPISPNGLFTPVLHSMIGERMASNLGSQIPLSLVGELTNQLQARFKEIVCGFPQSTIQNGACIDSVRFDGKNFTTFSKGQAVAVSEKILLSCGSREQVLPVLQSLKERAVTATEIISERVACEGEVHIIGASHSAASVLWKILPFAKSITIWHRGLIRLFYGSILEAQKDGYHFTEQNVCLKTGRVNRFGGIRSPYRELFKQAHAGELPNVRFKKFDGNIESILSLFGPRSQVVQALGFTANRLPILEGDIEIGPLMNQSNHLIVDDRCRICDNGGRIIPGAYALGLGHQPRPSPELGGELSYTGPVDGFNLYSGIVGQQVVKELFL